MTKQTMLGSDLFCNCLQELGVECVFGLPGSQNISLYDALRRSDIRTILCTSESGAAFMANGYYRASGKLGVVATIPGPGFTNTLTGVAEAYLDSVPMLCITGKPARSPGKKFQLQAIAQQPIAAPVVKGHFAIERLGDIRAQLARAYAEALSGEPGPVLIEVDFAMLSESCSRNALGPMPAKPATSSANETQVDEVLQRIRTSQKIVLFVGQGVCEASAQVRELAEILSSPVLATSSGRGILSEQHALSFSYNFVRGGAEVAMHVLEVSDLILAFGCKFSHNGSGGFQYRLPQEKLIHVDASPEVLEANYPASIAVCADAPAFLSALLRHQDALAQRENHWQKQELDEWRAKAEVMDRNAQVEPRIMDTNSWSKPSDFFTALRQLLPADVCLVTDSGLHQFFVRRYFRVLSPRSLIFPSDFQSMGFGLPAAIGAKLSSPERTVVAVVGDGGFAMSAMEMLAAIREELSIKIILFNDGHLGLIRMQQLGSYGHGHAVDLPVLDYEKLAQALSIPYFRLAGDGHELLTRFLDQSEAALLEIRLKDSLGMSKMRYKTVLRNALKTVP